MSPEETAVWLESMAKQIIAPTRARTEFLDAAQLIRELSDQAATGLTLAIQNDHMEKRIAELEAERDKIAFDLRGMLQERDDYRRWLSEAKRDTRPTELEWRDGETDGIYANAAHGCWFEIDHDNDVSLVSLDLPWSVELEGFTNIESAKKYAEQTARALGLLRETDA